MVYKRKVQKKSLHMTYNPAIPQPNDILSQSQAQIQTNFAQADTIFDVNHITFDNASVASRGKHRRVDLIRVAAPGSIAAEAVVYQKLASGSSNLFMQRDGVAAEIQLTGPTPVAGANGEGFMAGATTPILYKWGQFTTGSNPQAMGYVADFGLTAFPTNTLMVQLTPINSGGVGNYRVSTVNAGSFTVVAPVGSSFFFYAIGN